VIGLTDDVMIIMETQDINFVLQLLQIPLHPLNNVTSPEEQILIKLELICDELNRYKVFKYGITRKPLRSYLTYWRPCVTTGTLCQSEAHTSRTHGALLVTVTPT
jgi:hypothetical protein